MTLADEVHTLPSESLGTPSCATDVALRLSPRFAARPGPPHRIGGTAACGRLC